MSTRKSSKREDQKTNRHYVAGIAEAKIEAERREEAEIVAVKAKIKAEKRAKAKAEEKAKIAASKKTEFPKTTKFPSRKSSK